MFFLVYFFLREGNDTDSEISVEESCVDIRFTDKLLKEKNARFQYERKRQGTSIIDDEVPNQTLLPLY